MRESKEFLLIRYMSLFFLLIETLVVDKHSKIAIAIILIYIINNQLRLYVLEEKNQKNLSISIDIFLIVILGGILKIQVVSCGIILIIDSLYFKDNVMRRVFNSLIVVSYAIPLLNKVDISNGYRVLFLAIFVIACEYVVREHNEKLNAQELYHKLRLSEEELKKANKSLENYAVTIEELTLLKERNRISREIHDSVGHALSTSLIQLNAMEQLALKSGDNTLATLATSLRNFIKVALDDVRVAVRKLKPAQYSNYEGLIRIENLFKEFEKLTDVKIKFTISNYKWSLNSNQSQALYRIFQETLSNATRHGKAQNINVLMNFNSDSVIISIKDNGIGVEKVKLSGLGLMNIKERVKELKGEVNFYSEKGIGFNTKIIIPKEDQGEKI